jgi:tripartite-type tricarboxylate transporter receptor subunit TctC
MVGFFKWMDTMQLPRRQFLHLAAGAAAPWALSQVASAQAYPTRPVRIIVPFAAGGPSDVIARLVAQKLTENLGKPFYVENQVGAGGNIGMGNAARASPDGYTILFATSSYVVNPSLYSKVPYDPDKDFAPLTVTADAANILLVHPSVPASTVKELVDLIKANPGKYSFAHAGIGTTLHLSGEMFKLSAALDLVGVPFNGGAPAVQSTMAGHTPILFSSLPSVVPLVKDGKLRALAVAAKARAAALPDVPTMDEAGFKGQEANTFQAMLIPAATPKEIQDLLHREIVKALKLPDVKARLEDLGLDVVANSQEEFAAQIKEEIVKWREIIRAANIKAE